MAEGFKIADGFIEISPEVDLSEFRAAAKAAGLVMGDESVKVGRRWMPSFFAALFTPNPAVLSTLRTGVPAALSTPLGLAAITLGVSFAVAFVAAAITSLLTGGLAAIFLAVGAFVMSDMPVLGAVFEELVGDILDRLKSDLQAAVTVLAGPFREALDMISAAAAHAGPALKAIFEGLAPTVVPITAAVLEFVRIVGVALAEAMPAFGEILVAWAEILPMLAPALADMFAAFAENKDAIIEATENIGKFLILIIEEGTPLLIEWTKAFNTLWPAIDVVVTFIFNLFEAIAALINSRGNLAVFFAFLHDRFSGIGDLVDNVIGFFVDLPGNIVDALGDLDDLLLDAGKDLIKGLVRGIASQATAPARAVGDIIHDIKGAVTSGFGLFSPSRVFAGYGRSLIEGLTAGIQSKLPDLNMQLSGVRSTAEGALTSNVNSFNTSHTWEVHAWNERFNMQDFTAQAAFWGRV